MTSISASQLRNTFTQQGMLDLSVLTKPDVWSVYSEVLTQLIKEAQEEFQKISTIPEAEQSFATVVEPFHAFDEQLKMAWLCLDAYHNVNGSEQTTALIQEFQPQIVRFNDEILLHRAFFTMLEGIWEREEKQLTAAQRRSLELLLRDRRIAGVHLPDDQKKYLQELNEKHSELAERFARNTVESRRLFFRHFTSLDVFENLPAQDASSASEEAKNRGLEGWVFTLSPPSKLAVMRYCKDREIREQFLREGYAVGARDPYDNRPLILELLALRTEKAKLLGFEDYAAFVLQTRMASDTGKVHGMIAQLEGPYRKKAVKDIEALKVHAGRTDLQLWDVSFESRKLMKELYNIEDAVLQEYFEFEAVLRGLFSLASTLFGLEMRPMQIETYDLSVRCYEVYRQGKHIGYFMLDLFARPTKRAGAWCNYLRPARTPPDGARVLPIITNVGNFAKGTSGHPTLLSHYDVTTLFHEFGHALHQLLSEHQYPNLESFAAELDFIELPSQLLENWCWQKEGLSLFAKHVKTGESFPDEMIEALKRRRTFMTGFEASQQLEYAILDLELHTLKKPLASPEELDAFCLAHERHWNVLPVPDWYRMHAAFTHIFSGSYDVGYYSYLWSEMLEADAFGFFEEQGIVNPDAGERYRAEILAQGAMKPGQELYRAFRGRDADSAALLRKKGVQ